MISSGGLGPTLDDLTREAVAELLGRKLVLNTSVLQDIEARFRRLGRTMPEVNKRQAMVPEGADLLENSRGTAPGLWLESAGRIIVLLPGPPHELKAMFTEKVEPRLERLAGATRLYYRELRTAGLTESEVEQRIAPIYTQYTDVQTTILTAPGEIQIHLRAWSPDGGAAEHMLDEMVERITFALGENVFTSNGQTLEEIVARELTLNHATVATAESCTGGLLAERLTRVPGSSSYFLGGVVCYSNDLKTAWADVPAELIEAKGAVSPEVAAGSRARDSPPHRRHARASALPESPGPPAARRRSPSAWCISPLPTPMAARTAPCVSRAIASASAGTHRRRRSIWCAAISFTRATQSRPAHRGTGIRPGSTCVSSSRSTCPSSCAPRWPN